MTTRIALVSTYPPRPCGIGTFSRDLRSALLEADPSLEVDVVSIVRDHHRSTEPEVLSVIRQDVRADYVAVPGAAGRPRHRCRADRARVRHLRRRGRLLRAVAGPGAAAAVRRHAAHGAVRLRPHGRPTCCGELCHRAALVTVFTETARRMVVDAGVAPAGPGARRPARRPDRPAAADRRTPTGRPRTRPCREPDGRAATMAHLRAARCCPPSG